MPGLLRKVAPGARIHRADIAASLGLVALFLLDEDSGVLRDLVGGARTPLSSGGVGRGPAGRILTFNGAQATNLALRLPANPPSSAHRDNIARFSVLGRLRPDAAAASDPAAIFGLYSSAGEQNGFGIGWNTSLEVGAQLLSGNGAATSARSPGSAGTWYTVFASAAANGVNSAWIDGRPATTSQGASADGATGAALNEVSFGAQHRSAGFLRYANGALEWGAVLHGRPLNDAAAWRLYADDFPYNLLTPRRRYWLVPGAGGSDATAPGTTVTIAASVVAGAASAASAVVGATLSASAILVAGAATAASAANGATLAAAATLVAGAGAAASTAPGATATATVGLLAGTATAASAAPGSTVGAIASLLAGSATGTGDGAATGATLATVASVIAGPATAASTAAGAVHTVTASLVAGAASAASAAAGATLTASASVIAGTASGAGNATAGGATVVAMAGLVAGAVSASSSAGGGTLPTVVSILPGAAIAGGITADRLRTIRLRAPRALALPQPAMPALTKPRRLVA